MNPEMEEVDMEKEVTSKNSKIKAIRFLAEYAKNPNRKYAQVADKMGMNRKTAQSYLKNFIYLIESTRNDTDFLETVLEYYNYDLVQAGVDENELFKASYIQQLSPLITRYGHILEENNPTDDDFEEKTENRTVSYKNKNISNTYDNMSFEDDYGDYDDPEEERVNDGLRDMVDSNNTKILRKVLRHIPEIAPKHIPNIISLFKMREEELMKDPEAFKEFLLDYFNGRGRKAKLIFDSFSHMVKNYGNEYAGFGVNPMTGVPFDDNPFGRSSYGGQQGGFGVPNMPTNPAILNSPQYYQYLAEKERTMRQRREEDDINNSIGRYVKTATIGMLQNANQNKGQGGTDDWIKYAMMGLVRPTIRFNQQTGQQEVTLEPMLGGQQGGGMFGGGQAQGGENSIMSVLLKGVMDTNNMLMAKTMNPEGNLTNKLLESVIDKSINGGNDLTRQVEQFKAMQEMFGGGKGHVKTPAEIELDLKRDELSFKKELMLNDMNNKQQQFMYERQAQERQEQKADQNTKDIMNGITQTLQYIITPILGGLQHGNLPAGLQGMLGGQQGQAPQAAPAQQEVMGGEYASEYDAMSPTMRAYFDRQKDEIMRNNEENMAYIKKQNELNNNNGVAPQQQVVTNQQQIMEQEPIQPQQQQRKAEIGRRFTAKDFEDYTEEELMEAKKTAMLQKKSINSYNDSIEEALAKHHYVRNEAFEDEDDKTPRDDTIILPDNIDPDYTGNIPKPQNNEILAGSNEKKEPAQEVDTNAIFGITSEKKEEIMSNEPAVLEEVDMDEIEQKAEIIKVEKPQEPQVFKEEQAITQKDPVVEGHAVEIPQEEPIEFEIVDAGEAKTEANTPPKLEPEEKVMKIVETTIEEKDNVVAEAKIQDIASDTLIGREAESDTTPKKEEKTKKSKSKKKDKSN